MTIFINFMKSRKILFWIGLIIIVLLGASYFIKINIDSGTNYNVEESILAIIIFQNVWVLVLYLLVCAFLMFFGIRKGRKR